MEAREDERSLPTMVARENEPSFQSTKTAMMSARVRPELPCGGLSHLFLGLDLISGRGVAVLRLAIDLPYSLPPLMGTPGSPTAGDGRRP
jgi:hypothetical protein